MKRSRDYHRKMRVKHIRRKKRITSHYWGADEYPYYKFDGMYSKGKIHCSCSLCKIKAYYGKHVPTIQEKRNYLSKEDLWDESFEIAG